MSYYNFSMKAMVKEDVLSPTIYDHPEASKCMMPMGLTSENVAEQYGISRKQQDQMAYESHYKATQCQKNGWSKDEITVYETIIRDKEGNEKTVKVEMDDGVRPKTTMESLGKLKPVFKKNGTTTAGNSS